MVQIKLFARSKSNIKFCLYIPYGSDKTVRPAETTLVKSVFISHMVQIKLFSIPPNKNLNDFLYIPYGSDKTQTPTAKIHSKPLSLYPIWFR